LTPAERWHEESGTGLISSAAGATAFLMLMLFAVQLLTNLYATTTVTAAGLDAARTVASRSVDHTDRASVSAAQSRAEAQFRQMLGSIGREATLTWSGDGRVIRLRVEVRPPGIVPRSLATHVAFGEFDRTFTVAVEDLR